MGEAGVGANLFAGGGGDSKATIGGSFKSRNGGGGEESFKARNGGGGEGSFKARNGGGGEGSFKPRNGGVLRPGTSNCTLPPTYCITIVAVLADISLRSPRKIIIFIS